MLMSTKFRTLFAFISLRPALIFCLVSQRYECIYNIMNQTEVENTKMHLILPSAEKIVCVTSVEAFDDILVSANHLDGTPRTRMVSGLFAIFLTGFPEQSKHQFKLHLARITTKSSIFILKNEFHTATEELGGVEILPRLLHCPEVIGGRDLDAHPKLNPLEVELDPGQLLDQGAPPLQVLLLLLLTGHLLGLLLLIIPVAAAWAEEGEVADVEDARGDGLVAAALMQVGEGAHGEVGVGEDGKGEGRVAEEGEERGLELPLVDGADGEVGAEEGEEQLEARREGEAAREGERLGRPEGGGGGGHGGAVVGRETAGWRRPGGGLDSTGCRWAG